MNLKAVKIFEAELVRETIYSVTPLGKAKNKMSLYIDEEKGKGTIEWEINYENEGDDVEIIGVWMENNKITDYDGVFDLPKEAIELLEENGYDCSEVK